MLPELGQGQQRAITYLWAATQVAATVVRDAFVEIYSSLPDSGGGHISIREYCRLAGRSGVYLELLDEGYLSSHLAGSPRDAAFLDLKVTRKMLEKVLAEKFDRCGKYGKLVFEVRQLVYLRNDLCHQLLPALPADQYLAYMQQLETRLCTVTRQAALLAGAANPPEAALHHIRALFTSLLYADDDLTHRTDRRPRTDSGTQADLHLATLEKGVQANTIPLHDPGPAAPMKEKIDSLQRQAKEKTSENTNYEQELGKILADSPDPGTPRGGAVTHGIDAAGGGRQGCYHDDGCRITRNFKNSFLRHSDATPVKGNKKLFTCHNTETNTAPTPCLFPGRSLRHKLCGEGIMKRNTPSNYAASRGFATLPFTTMTVNHVAYTSHKGPCVSSVLDVGLSLLLTVMLFLGVFSVTTLPLGLTILRLAVSGLYYLLVQAKRACRHLIGNLCSGKGPREVVCMTEVVLISSVTPEKVCGPAMVRPRDENVTNFWKSDWKVSCRRKKRKKNTRMIN